MGRSPAIRPWLAVVVVAVSTVGMIRLWERRAHERVIAGHEAAVFAALETIARAQKTFAATCGDGRFATNLIDLGEAPPGGMPLLPPDLGSSIVASFEGYQITLRGVPAVDFESADRCHSYPLAPGYLAMAIPEQPGETGRRSFSVDASGRVR